MHITRSLILIVAALASSIAAAADELEPLLATLRAVGPKGAGHREATVAWQKLARADVEQLPVILAGLDEAGPLAANWIRTAVDAIVERQLQQGGKLPAIELERFALEVRHAPRGRRLAYELLCDVDPSATQRLIPRMLDDPSLEMRRDAIARLIDEATELQQAQKTPQAIAAYEKAFAAARDIDQIKLLAERLTKLDRKPDLPRHLGFVIRWKVIGPFDNTGEKGYDVVYPPEQKLDLAAQYDGKHNKVKWIDHATDDAYGKVDLNKVLVKEKDVVGYAAAEFVSDRRQEVQFRVTSYNAVKLWLGGRLIDQHNVYHGGSQLDQYVCTAELKPGCNTILLKSCQNAQTQSWAEPWAFQLRVCAGDGTAILSAE
ncbi:MAG: hypothetical protein HQ567_09105 [Candidatus Nealsonbacteria bacterium]|nr:hypothetical protein [Candidatus Nealsonbacteria bacterium]